MDEDNTWEGWIEIENTISFQAKFYFWCPETLTALKRNS